MLAQETLNGKQNTNPWICQTNHLANTRLAAGPPGTSRTQTCEEDGKHAHARKHVSSTCLVQPRGVTPSDITDRIKRQGRSNGLATSHHSMTITETCCHKTSPASQTNNPLNQNHPPRRTMKARIAQGMEMRTTPQRGHVERGRAAQIH